MAKVLAGPALEYAIGAGLTAIFGANLLRPYRDSPIGSVPPGQYHNTQPPSASAPSSSPSASSPPPPLPPSDAESKVGMLMMMSGMSREEVLASPTMMAFANEALVESKRDRPDPYNPGVAGGMHYATTALDTLAFLQGEELILDREIEIMEGVNQRVIRDALRMAVGDVGSAVQAPNITSVQFAHMAASRGVDARLLSQVGTMIFNRFGDTDRAQAALRQWVVRRVVPKVAGGIASSVATYVMQQAYAAFREGKGGKIDEKELRKRILSAEIDEAANAVDAPDDSDGGVFTSGVSARNKINKYLNGSVANIASTDAPLGPIDRVIPKSSPTLPSSGPTASPGPAAGIFSNRLEGDNLSERRSQPAANVLKTSIPAPPVISTISPYQSYLNLERIPPPNPAPVPSTPPQNVKRKADTVTPGHDALMASQVTATYDATNAPALPNGVTGPTSARWEEYQEPFKGYNVPLTDAPNIVGIGFDAETMERKLAEGEADESPQERKAPEAMGLEQSTAPQKKQKTEETAVNTANETNPALANKGRPAPTSENPVAKVPPLHITY